MSVGAARALLGVKEGATRAEIRAAFRRTALRVHPDHTRRGSGAFHDLCAAADLLEKSQHGAVVVVADTTSWESAVARVKFGPALHFADDGFPNAFEMEERNVGASGPLLRLVHGREAFGEVREARDGLLELCLDGQVKATATLSDGELRVGRLRLRRAKPGPTLLGFGGFASSVVVDTTGATVYGLYESRTPGVATMVWHAGRILARVSRPWMPHAQYWLPFFDGSRSPGYGSDGRASAFYFERRGFPNGRLIRDDHSRTTTRLDPALCVFTAAFQSLDSLHSSSCSRPPYLE